MPIQRTTVLIWLLLCQWVAAGLEFESLLNEVHAPADATEVSSEFRFTNTGRQPVTISHVDPDCSCIGIDVADGKLVYQSGESGVIRTTFKIGNQSGQADQSVAVWLKDDPKDKPSIRLNVRIHIPQLVSIHPKSLKWQLGADMAPQSIRVTIDHDKPIHVTGVASSKPAFQTQIVTIEEGKLYDIVVTPRPTTHSGMAIIRIETDAPVEKDKSQQAFAMVLKEAYNREGP